MRYEATYLDCCDCSQPFPFSTAQQALYAELGYDEPGRCPGCRRSLEKARRPIPTVSVRV